MSSDVLLKMLTLYSSTIYDAILLCFRDVVSFFYCYYNATTNFFDFQATLEEFNKTLKYHTWMLDISCKS